MKYTEEQKRRALKKLATTYGKWNKFEPDDHLTHAKRDYALHTATFKVIEKFGMLNDYRLAVGDIRGKKK